MPEFHSSSRSVDCPQQICVYAQSELSRGTGRTSTCKAKNSSDTSDATQNAEALTVQNNDNRDVKITGRRWFGAAVDIRLKHVVVTKSTQPLNHIGLRDADRQTDAGLALKRRKTVPNGQ
jgi:hypothetical protein